jgi:hypothetical protein
LICALSNTYLKLYFTIIKNGKRIIQSILFIQPKTFTNLKKRFCVPHLVLKKFRNKKKDPSSLNPYAVPTLYSSNIFYNFFWMYSESNAIISFLLHSNKAKRIVPPRLSSSTISSKLHSKLCIFAFPIQSRSFDALISYPIKSTSEFNHPY